MNPSALLPPKPWQSIILIGCIVFAEPLTSTLLFPFVYFMVRGFTKDEGLIGFRVGLINKLPRAASSFFLCQFVTTPLWGLFSDRFGRKTTFMVGLLGGAVSIACFGLSSSLTTAVLSRSISGLLNGNIAVARTALAEVAAKYEIKQSKVFSLFGFCGALGYIAGPLIGGMLSKPAESLGFPGPSSVFVTFPYFLPCLISCCFNLSVMGAAFFGLEETNKAKLGVPQRADEEDPLLPCSLTAIGPSGMTTHSRWKLPKEVIVLMTTTALISLHTIMFEEVYALFAASSLDRRTGLGFQPRQIALSLSVLGPATLVTQLLFYPALNAQFDTIKLLKTSAVIFAIDYPIVSLLPLIQDSLMRGIALVTVLCIRVACVIIGWTSLNILTTHVVRPDQPGLVTGIVQASASLSRAVGPIFGGTLWSWSNDNGLSPPFDFHLFFLTISLLAVLQNITASWIPLTVASKN